MISLKFLLHLASTPLVILRTVFQYYTTGTVYSNTSIEFKNSLRKNIYLSVLYHYTSTYTASDVQKLVYRPLTKILDQFRSHHLCVGLNGYGKPLTEKAFWLVKNELPNQHVLAFFHGGGYAINIFETQFMGILALYYSLPASHRKKISIVILDYSLTCNGHLYPTQIKEAVDLYQQLLQECYKNISIIGDSAGGNLNLALNRFIAYPLEASTHFEKFTQFEGFDFTQVHQWPQPSSVMLISPWVEPLKAPKVPSLEERNTYGDLGAVDTEMAEWYIGDLSEKDVHGFFMFDKTTFEKDWANVSVMSNSSRNLWIMGEREVLKEGVENLVSIIGKDRTTYLVEEGGVHDCLFYVEGFDFLHSHNETEPDFTNKFCYNHVSDFLVKVMDQ